MDVRDATHDDYDWLKRRDRHVTGAWIRRCISHREYLVCERDRVLLGLLRYSLFWGAIPYMDMIFVDDGHRRRGVGTALFETWQARMMGSGATVLMTSSVSTETAPQEWHRRNGFETSGQLTFGQYDSTPETFLVKNL